MKRLPRRLTITLLAALVVLVAIAAGCTQAPSAPSSPTSQPAQAADVPAPTMKLVTPAEGATVAAGDVKIVVETTGHKFVMPSNTNVPGEGHVHFTLDDQPFKMSTSPEFVYEGVTAGKHTLKAELVQNDTKEFDPPVIQTITFVVK